jgi:cobalt-zinc-cadmium efflux system protein
MMKPTGHTVLRERPEARRLLMAILITAAILIAEVVGGILSNSLALLSDAGHMFTDMFALALSYFGIWAACRPVSERASFGYHRVEILTALGNGSILFLLAGVIVWEAVQRIADPPAVHAPLMLVIATIGLVANGISAGLLTGHGSSLNLRAARWHVLGDAISSLGVIVAGGLIWLTGWLILDPLLSIGIAVIIVIGAARVLKESVDVLLEATPAGLRLADVSGAISQIQGISTVHDLHVWSITTGMIALSGHVVVESKWLGRTDELLNRIKIKLKEEFRIEHTTIQVESENYDEIGHVH